MGPHASQRQTCKAWGQKATRPTIAADWGGGDSACERRGMLQESMDPQGTQGTQQEPGNCLVHCSPGSTALPAASSPNNHDGVGREGIAPQLQACQAHVLSATAQVACHGLQELQLFSASSRQRARQVASLCMQTVLGITAPDV